MLGDQQSDDTLSPDFYKGLNVLGKPTSVSLVGQEGGPPGTTLTAGGAPTAPSAGGSTSVMAPKGIKGGGDPLMQQIMSLLGLGEKFADKAGKFLGGTGDLGTRGTIGGEGTPQTSDTSLSDTLRSRGLPQSEIDQLVTWLQQAGASESSIAEALMGGTVPLGEAGGALGDVAGAGFGAIGDYLPYVGAVLPAAFSFASGGPKDTKEWANLGVETAAAAAAPFTWGASEAAVGIMKGIEDLMAGAPGWQTVLDFGGLGMLKGFLDKPGGYGGKRQRAGSEGQFDLSALGAELEKSARQFAESGDPSAALKGLQTQFGARNPVRSDLSLPFDVAQQLGIVGNTYGGKEGHHGTQQFISWEALTPETFAKVMDYFSKNPGAIQTDITGSGDVAYLPGPQAQVLADAAANQARQYLKFLIGAGQGGPAAPAPGGQDGVAHAAFSTAPGPAGGETSPFLKAPDQPAPEPASPLFASPPPGPAGGTLFPLESA